MTLKILEAMLDDLDEKIKGYDPPLLEEGPPPPLTFRDVAYSLLLVSFALFFTIVFVNLL